MNGYSVGVNEPSDVSPKNGRDGKPQRKKRVASPPKRSAPVEDDTILKPTALPELKDEDLKKIANNIVRTWDFWWRFGLALIVLGAISYFGISKHISGKIVDSVEAMQTNAISAVLNEASKVSLSIAAKSSNELLRIETALSNVTEQANLKLSKADEVITNIQRSVEFRINASYRQMTNRLARELVERITAQFEDARIKSVVSNVATHQARGIIAESIAPSLSEFTNELGLFKANAEASLVEVKESANFSVVVGGALGDEARSFDKLVALRDSPTLGQLATQIVGEIASKLTEEQAGPMPTMNIWEGTTNDSSNATREDYVARYSNLSPVQRMYWVHEVFTRDRIPMHRRLEMLSSATKGETSLRCRFQICHCFNLFRKTQLDILGLPLHLQWWDRNKQKVREEYEAEQQAKKAGAAQQAGGEYKNDGTGPQPK